MGLSPIKNCQTNYSMPLGSSAPNPSSFVVKYVEEFNGGLLAKIKYRGCTNYEGDKILVFRGLTATELRRRIVIDPHFSEDGKGPIARFEPTEEGLKMARLFCLTYFPTVCEDYPLVYHEML